MKIKIWIEDDHLYVEGFGSENLTRILPLRSSAYVRIQTMPGTAALLYVRKITTAAACGNACIWDLKIESTCQKYMLLIKPNPKTPKGYILPCQGIAQPDVLHVQTETGTYTYANAAAKTDACFFDSLFSGMQEANANEVPVRVPRTAPPAIMPELTTWHLLGNPPK